VYIFESRHQNAGRNHDLNPDNESFEIVAEFGNDFNQRDNSHI